MARFLLRDGNKVGADVCPEGLEVITYTDRKGQQVHALATVKAEREFFRKVPSRLLLYTYGWSRLLPRPLVVPERCRSPLIGLNSSVPRSAHHLTFTFPVRAFKNDTPKFARLVIRPLLRGLRPVHHVPFSRSVHSPRSDSQ